jgi:phosphoglycolate phosphatase-like HAD superfamily hydrolase
LRGAERDVLTGSAARMHTLIACFGYIGPMENARASLADGWIDSPRELRPWAERRAPEPVA